MHCFSASFHQGCVKVSPESCFLTQFKVERKNAQPFGYNDDPKEILVWHTKTKVILFILTTKIILKINIRQKL